MITVRYAPFHPHLERDLVRFLKKSRKDPRSRIAVVTPSRWLIQHLQEVCLNEGVSLFNVSFLTLHALVFRVLQQEEGPSVSHPILSEYLITRMLEQGGYSNYFRRGVEKAGFASALYQAFRDLEDAGLEPDTASRAFEEGYISGGERIKELFQVYQEFQQEKERLGIEDYPGMYRKASDSSGLRDLTNKFKHLVIYGFYDLTGSQLELVESLGREGELLWLYPFDPDDPKFEFARPFYESEVMRLAGKITGVSKTTSRSGHQSRLKESRSLHKGKRPFIVSACGVRDEVWWVAKKILELTDRRGYQYEDIGVVARGLEIYREALVSTFRENSIPFCTGIGEPITRHPLVRVVLSLATLVQDDFPRGRLMEILRSPYLLFPKSKNQPKPRPDLWDLRSRQLGIIRGLDTWSGSFRRLVDTGKISGEDQEIEIDPKQAGILLGILEKLQGDFEAFPREDSFAGWAETFRSFLSKYLNIDLTNDNEASAQLAINDDIFNKKQLDIIIKLKSILYSISELDRIGSRVSWEDFIDCFSEFVEQARVPIGIPGKGGRGLRILDAMGARGLGFKILFLLGMNEKNFPRFIQEEPFFRDQVRKQIRDTMGFRIAEKLKAFEEERLLFHLVLNSAPEVVILYQRSDESGKALSPSLYLSELTDEYTPPKPNLVLPRNWNDKFKNIHAKLGINYLNKKENVLNILLSGGMIDPKGMRRILTESAVPRLLTIKPSGAERFGRLNQHDGILGIVPKWWSGQREKGFSAHSLETYVKCPFQFFASRMLNLEYLEEPEISWGIGPDRKGHLYHMILYKAYIPALEQKSRRGGVEKIFESVAQDVFQSFERDNPPGFPLIWQVIKEEISQNIQMLISWDAERIRREGLFPSRLEAELSATVDLEEELGKMLFRGRVDRVDEKRESGGLHLEIIDYKSGSGPPVALKLETRMKRGISLQPAIYFLIVRDSLSDWKKGGEFSGDFSFWYITGKGEDEGPLVQNISYLEFINNSDAYMNPLKYCLNSIRQGLFFINPNNWYCQRCNFSAICRKSDPAVLFRLERDERAEKFRDLGK